jgi:hypothetical protein
LTLLTRLLAFFAARHNLDIIGGNVYLRQMANETLLTFTISPKLSTRSLSDSHSNARFLLILRPRSVFPISISEVLFSPRSVSQEITFSLSSSSEQNNSIKNPKWHFKKLSQ